MNTFKNTSINPINCSGDFPYNDVTSVIKQLSNPDKVIRMEAGDILSCIGAPAVPELLSAMKNADTQLRWHIIKVFDNIQDPQLFPSWLSI